MIALCLALLNPTLSGGNAQSAEHITIEPRQVDVTYCLERGNGIRIELVLNVDYVNRGERTIILPHFTDVVAYTLVNVDRHRVERREAFRRPPMLDTTQLDPSRPDPKFFGLLPPGEKLERELLVTIPLRLDRRKDASLLGVDHFLQVEVDHWPDARRPGFKLREAWKETGLLWMDKLKSLPVRLHLEEHPEARPCGLLYYYLGHKHRDD